MYGLVVFRQILRKSTLPMPKTGQHYHYHWSLKWVTWDFDSFNHQLQLSASFIQSAQYSGKAVAVTTKEGTRKTDPKREGEKIRTARDNVYKHEQVRQVLQDYLYYTRSLTFADAKNISFNAPSFVNKLSSIVHPSKQKNITKSLQKHLLCNPINEFEPFLESIGIQPCDIPGILPRHQIHLNENQSLLLTVSTLINIGFPRYLLGKLYQEEPEIFSSSAAKLQKKLQFYEDLGVSKASIVKVITFCPSLLNEDVHRNFKAVANGLNGFQVERNRICCLMEENRQFQSSVLEKLMLLVGIGFPWDEISKLYHTKIELFIGISEKALYSIIEVLSSLGLGKKDIGRIVLRYPEILKWEIAKSGASNTAGVDLDENEKRERILRHIHDLHGDYLNKFLKGAVGTVTEKEFSVLSREHHKNKLPSALLSRDIPENLQSTHSQRGSVVDKTNPQNFRSRQSEGEDLVDRKNDLVVSSIKHKKSADPQKILIQINENFGKAISRHKLVFMLKLGLAESSEQIVKIAKKKFRCPDHKLQERVGYLLGLGLPFHVICKMVSSRPDILARNTDAIQKKVDFLYSSSYNLLEVFEYFPAFFHYNLQHRIIPRCKMYNWLRTNNMLLKESSLWTLISKSEKIFLENYVSCHPGGENYFKVCKTGQL